MLERTEERFGLKPGYLVADTAYGSAKNLGWLVKQKQITPHIPVFDKSARTDGTFSRSDFTFDPEANPLHLPGRQASPAVSPQLCKAENRRHRRRHAPLSSRHERMRRLRPQAPLLSQYGGAEDPTRCRRGRARCRPRASQNAGI
jgi:hypothetical protein